MLLFAFGFLGILPTIVMENVRMSSQCAAAELFMTTPLESSAPLFHGVRKAATVMVLLPMIVTTSLAFVALQAGALGILPMAVPALLAMPLLSMLPALFGPYLPLSEPPSQGSMTSRGILIALGTMFVAGILCLATFLAAGAERLWQMIVVEFVVVLAAVQLMHRGIRRLPIPRITD